MTKLFESNIELMTIKLIETNSINFHKAVHNQT